MAKPNTRAMFRDIACILLIPAGLLVATLLVWRPWKLPVFVPQPPATVFSTAEGIWDWETSDSFCVADRHRIWFSPQQDSMYIVHARPWTDSTGKADSGAVYAIRRTTESSIRGFITDETRRTPSGELVVWDLILTSPNSYTWHRTDWAPGATTVSIRRCPSGS